MRQGSIKEILSGDVLKRGWFRRQYKLILLICGLIFVYIYAGYQAQRQQRHLGDLQKELQDVQFEQLTVNAQLVEVTRQSAVAEELRKRGSKVQESDVPAVRVN